MSIEDYLYRNFNNVERLSNGGFYAYNNGANGNRLYIPPNHSGSVDLLSYLPGSSGADADAQKFVEQIHSSTPPEYAISISGNFKDEGFSMETSYQALTNSGIDVNNVIEMTFSASGKRGFARLDDFLAKHPDVNCALVKVQGVTPETTNFQNLIDNNTPVIVINATDAHYVFTDEARRFTNGGINYFWLQSDSISHKTHNSDLISNHFIDYLFGYTDSFGNFAEGSNRGANYRLVRYDNGLNGVVYANYDDIIIGEGNPNVIPNLSRLKMFDSFDVKEVPFNKTDDMEILSNLKRLSFSSQNTAVTSKYSYVEKSVNDFRDLAKNSNYLDNLKVGVFRSGSDIPGCISDYISNYFEGVSELLEKISMESESILSYAQAIIDMDADLASGVEDLGTITEFAFDSSDTPESSYVKQKKDLDDYYNNNSNDKSSNNNDDQTNNQNKSNDPGIITYEKRYSFPDGHEAYMRVDKGKIVEFKYKYAFNSTDVANNYKNLFENYYKNTPLIEKVVLDGTNVEILFNQEELSKLSIYEITEKYLKDAKDIPSVGRKEML